jgi:hypothetical protein
MIKAKITADSGFVCAPNGHTEERYECGTIVFGRVAEWALRAKAARRMIDKRDGAGPEEFK